MNNATHKTNREYLGLVMNALQHYKSMLLTCAAILASWKKDTLALLSSFRKSVLYLHKQPSTWPIANEHLHIIVPALHQDSQFDYIIIFEYLMWSILAQVPTPPCSMTQGPIFLDSIQSVTYAEAFGLCCEFAVGQLEQPTSFMHRGTSHPTAFVFSVHGVWTSRVMSLF